MYNALLDSFVCIADSGSFNKAAEKLFISSTAVIKQINSLEKHFDMQLFVRTKQGITLTPAGQVIYRHAKEMFLYSEQALAEARRTIRTEQTIFRVGTSILNPCKPFMDLWYQVNDRFPGFRLQVIPFDDDHSDILEEVSALGEKFDFLIAACDSKLWLNRCNFQTIGTYRHCIAVPREHSLAKKKQLSVRDLYGETVMLVKPGDSDVVDQIRGELSKHPQINLENTSQFYDMGVFNRCVQAHQFMLTLECWADVHPALVTIPVDWEFSLPYGILFQLQPNNSVQRFIQAIQQQLNTEQKNAR